MIWKSREFLPPFTLSRYCTWAFVPAHSFFTLARVCPLPKKDQDGVLGSQQVDTLEPGANVVVAVHQKIIFIKLFFLSSYFDP